MKDTSSCDIILARTESGEHYNFLEFLGKTDRKKSFAILSLSPEIVSSVQRITAGQGFDLLILCPDDMLHVQKRRLNKAKSSFIIYSNECKDTVWDLFNDGTTLLEDSFEIISLLL